MAVIQTQPIDYVNPVQGFIMDLGIADRLEKSKNINIVFNQAAVDQTGNSLWHFTAEDIDTKTSIVSATLNGKGTCTISHQTGQGEQPVCTIQLSLATMYSYDHPFASLRALDSVTSVADYNRKAWGIWMNTTEGEEIASYIMSTGEQCRLCCVGTVAGHEYEMVFYSNGSKLAKVKNDLIADRIYSFDAFTDLTSGHLNRVLARIEYKAITTPYTKTLCIFTLLALSCYNAVTFFNPKNPPPKRRKRRR